MARSLTVPFTARSPMEPPGKNIGRTTNESVEKASRAPPTDTTAESASPPSTDSPPFAGEKAGTNRCSTSSAESCPPPPWPITIFGELRSGIGQDQPSKSRAGIAGPSTNASANWGRLPGRGAADTAVEIVRGAGALAAHHGGAERGAGGAGRPEGRALVRIDEALQHLTAAAHRRLRRPDAGDVEPLLGVPGAVPLREPPPRSGDDADPP